MSNNEKVRLEYRESAFQKRLQTFAIIDISHTDLISFFNDAFHFFNDQIYNIQRDNGMIKVGACLSAEFKKVMGLGDGSKTEKQTIYIQTKSGVLDFGTNLERFYHKHNDVITTGSGFTLAAINELVVQANKYQPLHALSYIQLPKYLMTKKAIINVKNNDNQCFKWAVLSALHPVDHQAERVSKYIKYENELNFTGIEFPMKINQISKFERLNDSISINVYHFDSKAKAIFPLRVTKKVKSHHIHLLLLTAEIVYTCVDIDADKNFAVGT